MQTDNPTQRKEAVSQLMIVSHTKPSKSQVTDEAAHAIREQADKVLAKHRDELPPHIITLLNSPMISIVNRTLQEDIGPWLKGRMAKLQEEFALNHPDYEKVRDLLARGNFVHTGQFGEQIKAMQHQGSLKIMAKTAYQILKDDQVDQLRRAVEWVELKEARFIAKAKIHEPRVVNEIIVVGEDRRERKPKESRPVFTGLPPVAKGAITFANEFRYGTDDVSKTEGIDRSKDGGNRRHKPTGKKGKGGK